jgi:23S rRNA (pseudouridine1915-N3)-methyltransferase
MHLVFVGKTAFGDIESAIGRYVDRLQHYCQVEVLYVRAEKITGAVAERQVRERESERIRKLARRQGYMIVCDQGGNEFDSKGLSTVVEKLIASGISDIWVTVGGPVGVSQELLNSARLVLSLSKMTLPHDLARLMLVEQLYPFTIIKGEPYNR